MFSYSFVYFLFFNSDYEDPVFSYCPLDIWVTPAPGLDRINVTWVEPIVSDNSGSFDLTYQVFRIVRSRPRSIDPNSTGNGLSFSIGTYIITYNAADASGNSSSCSFEICVVGETEYAISLRSGV